VQQLFYPETFTVYAIDEANFIQLFMYLSLVVWMTFSSFTNVYPRNKPLKDRNKSTWK